MHVSLIRLGDIDFFAVGTSLFRLDQIKTITVQGTSTKATNIMVVYLDGSTTDLTYNIEKIVESLAEIISTSRKVRPSRWRKK